MINEQTLIALAQRAGFYISKEQNNTIYTPELDNECHAQLARFAQLLVKECCDIVQKDRQHPSNPNDCLLVLRIKDHFDVKE